MGYFRFCHYWVDTCLHSIDHWYRLWEETLADAAVSVSFSFFFVAPRRQNLVIRLSSLRGALGDVAISVSSFLFTSRSSETELDSSFFVSPLGESLSLTWIRESNQREVHPYIEVIKMTTFIKPKPLNAP